MEEPPPAGVGSPSCRALISTTHQSWCVVEKNEIQTIVSYYASSSQHRLHALRSHNMTEHNVSWHPRSSLVDHIYYTNSVTKSNTPSLNSTHTLAAWAPAPYPNLTSSLTHSVTHIVTHSVTHSLTGAVTEAVYGVLTPGLSWQGIRDLAWIAWHCVNTKGNLPELVACGANHCTADAVLSVSYSNVTLNSAPLPRSWGGISTDTHVPRSFDTCEQSVFTWRELMRVFEMWQPEESNFACVAPSVTIFMECVTLPTITPLSKSSVQFKSIAMDMTIWSRT